MKISEESLKLFLRDELGVSIDDVNAGTLLFSTGVIDSFALITLMTHIEKEGGFRINPADVNLNNFDSIERIVRYVNERG